MKQILITGGLGYFGRAIAASLSSNDTEITLLDWDVLAPEPEGSTVIHKDVREVKPGDLKGLDAVIHLAGIIGHKACEIDPDLAQSVNVEGMSAVGLAAFANDIPLIYVSTGAVYGAKSGDFVDEESKTNPLSLYAQTKLDAEKFALDAGACVLRLNHLNGASPRMTWEQFINNAAKETSTRHALEIYDPDTWRPATNIVDAIEAIELVFINELRGIFDIVGENHLKAEVAGIAQEFGANVTFAQRGIDLNDYRIKGDKFRDATGWEASLSIEDGFKAAFDVAQG